MQMLERDGTLKGIIVGAVAAIGLLILFFVAVFGSDAPRWNTEQPLQPDEVFMKAQFCIQTGRIPLIMATRVTCDDYRHGHRKEEAP